MPYQHVQRSYRPLTERFWAKVSKGDTDACWLWKGHITKHGYGVIQKKGRNSLAKAHRISWEIHYGAIPHGLRILHHCDIRACVNPSHLFIGTQQQNVQDAEAKGRMYHPHGEANHAAKLTVSQVQEIRSLYGDLNQSQLAKRYGVAQTTISAIVRRVNWG